MIDKVYVITQMRINNGYYEEMIAIFSTQEKANQFIEYASKDHTDEEIKEIHSKYPKYIYKTRNLLYCKEWRLD